MALTAYLTALRVRNQLGRHFPFPSEVQTSLLAKARLLETFGPQLGRPHVDTLKGSKHGNMKELRFEAADGVWRAAFAFDAKAARPGPRRRRQGRRKRKALLPLADRKGGRPLRQSFGATRKGRLKWRERSTK